MWYKLNPDKTISIYRNYEIGGEVVMKKETYRLNCIFSRAEKSLVKRNTIKPLITIDDIENKVITDRIGTIMVYATMMLCWKDGCKTRCKFETIWCRTANR